MGRAIYLRLAVQNIKNNRRTYVPYMLTGVFTVMMFYIMNFLALNKGIGEMQGASDLSMILVLGVWVTGIFSAIFLFYTNSFLIKRRKKELGLYNILGLEKKHIGRILFWEMIIVSMTSLIMGNLLGVLASKLIFLVLLKLLEYTVPLGYELSAASVLNTMKVFLPIYLLAFLNNLRQIHVSNPAELLRGGNVGEREPKTKLLLTLVGLVCLGAGYYIAIVTKSPVDALLLFFVAVILVMIGTYCLFTAVSIVILKLMRNNRKFYYKTRHFTSISGMIYRMKQNAVGLANICILSTAVLIMISGTVCLYAGREDILNTRFPREVLVSAVNIDEENRELLAGEVDKMLEKYQFQAKDQLEYQSASKTVLDKGDYFVDLTEENYDMYDTENVVSMQFISLEDYNKATGKSETLDAGEALVFANTNKPYGKSSIAIGSNKLAVKEELQEFFTENKSATPVVRAMYVVVDNMETARALGKSDSSEWVYYSMNFNLAGDKEKFIDFENELNSVLQNSVSAESCFVKGREASRNDFVVLYGGFLFLGIFLGLVFLMATAMIIYYKQVSEGMDDRERFKIMQKVGMSKREVRSAIRSQVLTVFFLPLLMAVIHIAFAFPMITRLLSSFSMLNVGLFAVCTLVTIGVFALVYGIIYALTAKVYYKIVY